MLGNQYLFREYMNAVLADGEEDAFPFFAMGIGGGIELHLDFGIPEGDAIEEQVAEIGLVLNPAFEAAGARFCRSQHEILRTNAHGDLRPI